MNTEKHLKIGEARKARKIAWLKYQSEETKLNELRAKLTDIQADAVFYTENIRALEQGISYSEQAWIEHCRYVEELETEQEEE